MKRIFWVLMVCSLFVAAAPAQAAHPIRVQVTNDPHDAGHEFTEATSRLHEAVEYRLGFGTLAHKLHTTEELADAFMASLHQGKHHYCPIYYRLHATSRSVVRSIRHTHQVQPQDDLLGTYLDFIVGFEQVRLVMAGKCDRWHH